MSDVIQLSISVIIMEIAKAWILCTKVYDLWSLNMINHIPWILRFSKTAFRISEPKYKEEKEKKRGER